MSNFELNAVKVGVFPTNGTELLLANHFVSLSDPGDGNLVLIKPGATTAITLGVLYLEDAKLNQTAAVVVDGYVPVYAAGTIAALDLVCIDVAGKVIDATDATTGDSIVGQAVTGGAAGELVTVQVFNKPVTTAA